MKKFVFAICCASLTLFNVACSDDGDGGKGATTAPDLVSTYNSTARDSVEAECACFAEDLGFSDASACISGRFDPLVLSSCEQEATRCEARSFEDVLSCQRSAQTDFQTCIEGCPADPQGCRDALEGALASCQEQRSDALLAHFETCRNGGSPVCSDPQFPGGPDAGGPGADAGSPQDMGTAQNRAPVANAGNDRSVLSGVSATLQGSGTDPDGDTLSYAWAIIDQPAGASPTLTNERQATATLTASTLGEYTVELTVDDGSLTDTDQVVVTVTESDQPPVAIANAPRSATIGDTVDLDASPSSDAIDSLAELDFEWSFTVDPSGGSSPISNSNSYIASFVPSSVGIYELEVTVTDTAGNTDTDTARVTVDSGPCVIISEYIEGAGDNKALEVYNCGTATVDLSRVGYCGEANADSIAVQGCQGDTVLTGTLPPNDVYVICHTNFSSAAFCDQFYRQVAFNGDDRVVIYYDENDDDSYTHGTDAILDVFGRLGQRPSDPAIWRDLGLRRCNFTPFDGMSAFDFVDYYDEVPDTAFDNLGDRPTETCFP